MVGNNIKNDLENSSGDYVYTVAKTALGFIPYIGGPISEVVGLIFSEPISKRRDKWLIELSESLQELKLKTDNFDIAKLSDNEQFITVVLKASQIAMRNHHFEKSKALINACTNTAIGISIDENEQIMFLNYVDELTVWHLRTLYYFTNPMERLKEKNIDTTSYAGGSPSQPFFEYYTELREKQEFTRVIVKDLYSKSLFNTDSLGGLQTAQGMLAPRLTDFGKRFMKYISEDHE